MEKCYQRFASHNSWSYLRPTKWWMRVLQFAGKCQRKDIFQQHWMYNVDCFDLRVRWDESGNIILAHGAVEYPSTELHKNLEDMDMWGKTQHIYCRVLLEFNRKPKDLTSQVCLFIKFCNYLKREFAHIRFFGGRLKYNWELLYKFPEDNDASLDDRYSSMAKPKWDDVWPWLYARLHNKKNIIKGTNKQFLFLDFVDIR